MLALITGLFLVWFFLTTMIVAAIYKHATRSYPYASEETFRSLRSLESIVLFWQLVAVSFMGTLAFFFFTL